MSKKMETPVNFLSGSPLNRLSWLRESAVFLNAAVESPRTRWLLFQLGQPLISKGAPAQLPTSSVLSLLGPKPFFGQGENAGDTADPSVSVLHSARHRGPPIVFLGLEEEEDTVSALPSSDFTVKDGEKLPDIKGTSFFAVDVSGIAQEELDEVVRAAGQAAGLEYKFVEPRNGTRSYTFFDAAVFGEARSMLDWNSRNPFCAGCGSPTYSIWGGWKLSCSSLMPWSDNTSRKPCPTTTGLHNFTHPRTDPVVITAVVDETGEKVLLGRNRRFPGNFYSTLAGFMEPGEAFEDTVKREIWEEAGVSVWDVRYHSSQPWPYPASMMVGFYAIADPSQPIRIDLDNELADARWFTRTEVKAVLDHPQGTTMRRAELKQLGNDVDPVNERRVNEVVEKDEVKEEPAFRLPPRSAIAGVLLRDWVDGKAGVATSESMLKGNL